MFIPSEQGLSVSKNINIDNRMAAPFITDSKIKKSKRYLYYKILISEILTEPFA